MTSRTRNFTILGIVAFLIVLAAMVIVPGTPLSKDTKLGLDLKGGIELVYQGEPTPQVPKVTPQSIDDAIETMRKRVDSLGVSEPEIQRAGANQIAVGLPSVKNAERAREQVGNTARLQFYDWEPNVLTDRDTYAGTHALFQATEAASTQKGKAEKTDIPNGKDWSPEKADRLNDTAKDQYYLFGPDELPISSNKKPMRIGTYEPSGSCKDLLADYEPGPGKAPKFASGTQCEQELAALGSGGPPAGSKVIKVPQGVVVVEQEPVKDQPDTIHRFTVLEDDSELSGEDIKNPKASTDQNNQPIVTMEFTGTGREAFARVTKRIAQRGFDLSTLNPGTPKDQAFQHFAITLDNKIVSLATIDFVANPEGIDGRTGAQIENIGDFNAANDLAEQLRIGALPIELKLISQTQVSATLGKQALHQGLLAGAAGLLLTIVFLLIFYRVLGAVATVALLIYAAFLFALVKLIPITLTLPGIAGMVLTLAVAADANIVMFERIKEEVRTGRSIPASIASGYSKALKTIIDANVVTVGVAFILFTLATAGVKGFAFTLMIGTLVSLFTAVLATSAMLGAMARSRLLRSPLALGAGRERMNWTRFDFMGNSRWFFSLSGAILATGAIAIAGLGINFGIDFESGTRITTPLEKAATVDQVRDVLRPLGYGDAKIQDVNNKELGKHVMQISVSQLEPGQVDKVEKALDSRFGVRVGDFSASSIGPTFGSQIARTAAIAVIASLLLISLYIGFRFEWKFAVPILIALAHDVLITSGVYALTEREVTTSTVAALLTIIGYSLYDTIIVFDRIRENVPRMPRATFSQIANRSMAEVLTRSLATSFTVLMPVGSLLLFGGETLKDFAFALLVGVASGAYSSIFIATPVLVEWKEREQVYMRRRRMVMEQHGGHVPAFATGTLGPEPAMAAATAGTSAGAAAGGPGGARPSRPRRARRLAAGQGGARTQQQPGGRAAQAPPTQPPSAPPPEPPASERPAPPPPAAQPPTADAPASPEPRPPTEPPAPPAPPASAPAGDGAPADGAPAGDGAPRESRTTSTAGSGAPKRKPKRQQRPRKKHGRSR